MAGRTDRKVAGRESLELIPKIEREHLEPVCPVLAHSSGKCFEV